MKRITTAIYAVAVSEFFPNFLESLLFEELHFILLQKCLSTHFLFPIFWSFFLLFFSLFKSVNSTSDCEEQLKITAKLQQSS